MFWSQFVSVCFTMKLFFYFKIHCLQTLQLFQTTDGPIFFIVTLVYTCSALFATLSTSVIIVSVKECLFFFSNFCRDGHKTFLFNKLCSKCQSWRRYLLQFSHCYGVTKMQPSGNLLSFYAVSTTGPLVPKKKIFEGFLPYMGVASILVMWPRCPKQTFVPPAHGGSTWNLALIGPGLLEIFENGGRTDNRACLYHKLTNEPKGSGELKIWTIWFYLSP